MDAVQMTQAMANNVDLLKSLELSGEEILYLPNPGNAGDSLIALATYQVLARLGIRYRIITPETECAGRTVVFGGGGALVSRLGGVAQLVARFQPQVKRLIILPHTVEGHPDLLAGLGSHVVIVCREPVSLHHVRQHAPRATAILGHDLALGLDLEMAMAPRPLSVLMGMAARLGSPWVTRRRAPFLFWAPFRRRLVQARARRCAGRASPVRLDVFRGDGERTDERGDAGNLDLPRLLAFGTHNELLSFYSSYSLLGTLAEVEVIRTNRLHVAIAGGLLGKQVEFFPNNYHKTNRFIGIRSGSVGHMYAGKAGSRRGRIQGPQPDEAPYSSLGLRWHVCVAVHHCRPHGLAQTKMESTPSTRWILVAGRPRGIPVSSPDSAPGWR